MRPINQEKSSAIVASGIQVVYPTSGGITVAIESIDFALGAGEFVSILGPSGCGKSTFLNVVAGLQRASAGTVTVLGKQISSKAHPDVGVVFQRPTLLPWLTVTENILIPIDAMRLKRDDYRDRVQDLLELTSLTRFARHYPGELSGGMQQRVGIARALIHSPKLILMDEPFAALDAMTRERMSVELQSILAESKQSVMFITHSIPEAVLLSDRVLMMSTSPGCFIHEREIKLARPRPLEVMSSPEFSEICGELRELYSH